MKSGFQCPGCQVRIKVGPEHAGRRVKCPKCGEVSRLPAAEVAQTLAPEPSEPEGMYDLVESVADRARARKATARARSAPHTEAAPTRSTRTPIEILAAFRGEIRPVRPTLLYRLCVLAIAGLMMALPAIYLAIVALVGYAVFYHATHNATIFQSVRNGKAAILAYGGPLVAGVIVIAFMLKPLFAGAPKAPKARRIDPSEEPLLAAFVDGVCSSVGAPTPSRIEVDCQINASAHLASWVLSPSKELVLTIGLPLVAGLTLRQFTGVLAHEFGHFSQGTGMRFSVLIQRINLWFARVVYERDEWDEALSSTLSEGTAFSIIAGLAMGAVWLTRRILWVLMQVGRLASGVLMRQMEYDADRYETRMVGGATFAETSYRLRELSFASNAAHAELAQSWRERRLPDDLPRLIRIEHGRMPNDFREILSKASEAVKGGYFDTHPPDRLRIRRARAEATDGIFSLDGPSTDLFRDFDALSRRVTFAYYKSMLGPDVSEAQLYPIDEALHENDQRTESTEALKRFFLGVSPATEGMPFPEIYPGPSVDPRAAKRELIAARESMQKGLEVTAEGILTWQEAYSKAVKAETAHCLLRAGRAIKANDFHLHEPSIAGVEQVRVEYEAVRRDALAPAGDFVRAAATRMAISWALLELEAVARRVPDGQALRDEARALFPCASALGRLVLPRTAEVWLAHHSLSSLIQIYHAGKDQNDRTLHNALFRAGDQVHQGLTTLRRALGDSIEYPFEHARQGVTLANYAVPEVPDSKAIDDLHRAADEALDRIFSLNHRVLGRLAAVAESVEKAIGLPPMLISESKQTRDEASALG